MTLAPITSTPRVSHLRGYVAVNGIRVGVGGIGAMVAVAVHPAIGSAIWFVILLASVPVAVFLPYLLFRLPTVKRRMDEMAARAGLRSREHFLLIPRRGAWRNTRTRIVDTAPRVLKSAKRTPRTRRRSPRTARRSAASRGSPARPPRTSDDEDLASPSDEAHT